MLSNVSYKDSVFGENKSVEEVQVIPSNSTTATQVTLNDSGNKPSRVSDNSPMHTQRGLRFWMCIAAIMVASFLMVLDIAGIGTVLPIVIADLHGREFEWVGSAYALSATAFLPLNGGLAQVFGRRSIMLLQVLLFAIGSALCGAAPSLNFLIASRTLQGIGAGGIAALSQIIIADLVPLQERGTFNGLIAMAYCFGTASAPVIAGALAERGKWRWFFYMNLPICALTGLLVFTCLDLKVPRGTIKEKLLRLDWTGNFICVASTTAIVIALTWGGIKFPWSSTPVLVLLILGLAGLFAFILYEWKVAKEPLVPIRVVLNRTSISGYIQGFFTNFYLIGTVYYLPVYFQACQLASPVGSGVNCLGATMTIMPFGLVSGISVARTGRYRPQIWLAWISLIVAGALLTSFDADTGRGNYFGYEVVIGLGLGILMTTAYFPVLAPLPVELNANALSFFMFVRFFSQVYGVTVGGTILQNQLQSNLPAEFIQQFPSGTSVAYSIIPIIPSLQEPFRTSVRIAFANSLRTYWEVLIGVSTVGLVVSFLMRGLPLHTEMDKDWGLNDEKPAEINESKTQIELNEAQLA